MTAAFGAAAAASSDLKLVIKRARLPMKKYDSDEIPESQFQPYMQNLKARHEDALPFHAAGMEQCGTAFGCLVVTNKSQISKKKKMALLS